MAKAKWKVGEPVDADAALHAGPGYFNDFNPDDVDLDTIDFQTESIYSILSRTVTKVFTPNKFKTAGTLYGILLRVTNPHGCLNKDASATGLDVVCNKMTKGDNKYKLITYKIRIPEIHFCLPIPSKITGEISKQDRLIIDSYPTFQAKDFNVAQQVVSPGDIVKVEIGNKGAMTRLYFTGPLGAPRASVSTTVGPKSPSSDYGKLLEECKKRYPNSGSPGDPISSLKNLSKKNSGFPLATSGIGIPDGGVIAGLPHKKWVVDLFKTLKGAGKYKGLIWTGICKHNGSQDDLSMLTNDGLRKIEGTPGRSTVIFMPVGTDPTQPLEIIYWFHDNQGFKNNSKEWSILWDSLREMSKKKESLGGARRNFVFVVPEMLWSEENAQVMSGIPRSRSTPSAPLTAFIENWKEANADQFGALDTGYANVPPGIPPAAGVQYFAKLGIESGYTSQIAEREYRDKMAAYTDRQWGAWGYAGPADAEQTTTKAFQPLPGGPLTTSTAGDMVLFHREILGLLQKYFGVVEQSLVENITLVADRRGGAAVSNLARMGKLGKGDNQINPSKIVYIHSDYGAANWSWKKHQVGYTYSKKGKGKESSKEEDFRWALYQEYHRHGDLYEILQNIDSTTRLEVHLGWQGLPSLPRQAAASFIGALTNIQGRSYESAKHQLKNIVEIPIDTDHFSEKGADVGITQYLSLASRWQKFYNRGYTLIRDFQKEGIFLPPPFGNVVYKGWPASRINNALAWIPAARDMPSRVALTTSTVDKDFEVVDAGPNVPEKVKDVFKKSSGRVILYESEYLGDETTKTTAIIKPLGTSVGQGYELIYYFHGDIGSYGAAASYQKAMENQFSAMVADNRNVIIVLMDINNNLVWSDGTFNDFHREVLDKIKTKWDTPHTAVDPRFFTIKAFGAGSHVLKNVIRRLEPKYIGNPGGLQRIDLWDANNGSEQFIINGIEGLTEENPAWETNVTLGENFEIQMVVSSKAIGPDKISAKVLAQKYTANGDAFTPGIFVIETDQKHGALPYTYFSAPSNLGSITAPPLPVYEGTPPGSIGATAPLTGAPLKPPVDLIYDTSGNAYDHFGTPFPEYNLSATAPAMFYKGMLENQTPSSALVGQMRECKVPTRKSTGNAAPPTPKVGFSEFAEQNCTSNPLGLMNLARQRFRSIKMAPTRKDFSWGTQQLDEYFKGIDSPMWQKTSNPTKWVVKDLSPQAANGVDKVKGHTSHREGIDADIVLPQLNLQGPLPVAIGTPHLKPLTPKELDVDRALAFLILSKLHGAKVVFLDRKFFPLLLKRANFIANDGKSASNAAKVLKVDNALKLFFREHLFGKPQFVKELMELLHHEPGNESHFHVRVTRARGSHQTKDYPKWAVRRLKMLGCNYKKLAAL